MNPFETPVAQAWKKAAAQAARNVAELHRMEHRWGRRRACRARVFVSGGNGVAGVGGLRNVSMSGAYLETDMSLPLFARIAVSVLLDDGSKCDEFTATVVRREAHGAGIEWTEPVAGSICGALGCAAHCSFAGDPA